MSVTVSSKYQVVIPESVRNHLHLRPGSQVDVIAKGGVAYLVPVLTLEELQRQLTGPAVSHDDLRDKKDRSR